MSPLPSRPHRILVVEDMPDVADVLRDALTELGYDVSVSSTGGGALDRIDRDVPDLVLLDLSLPDVPGVTVLERLRASRPMLPVVIVSGTDDEGLARNALARGAVDYVTKPVDFTHLGQVVALALAGRAH